MINKGKINGNIDMRLRNLYKDNTYILNDGQWIMTSNEEFSTPVKKKRDKMEVISDDMMKELKEEVIGLEYKSYISVTPLVYDNCRILIDNGRYRFIKEEFFEMINMESATVYTTGDLKKPIRFSNDLKHNEHIYVYPKIMPDVPYLKKPYDVFHTLCKSTLIKNIAEEGGFEEEVVIDILNRYNLYLAKEYWDKHFIYLD